MNIEKHTIVGNKTNDIIAKNNIIMVQVYEKLNNDKGYVLTIPSIKLRENICRLAFSDYVARDLIEFKVVLITE